VAIGAFTANNAWLDIVSMLVFGLLGMLCTVWRWPIPPLLLGMVLGSTAERNYFLSLSLFGNAWVNRPIVIVLMIISVAGLLTPFVSAYLDKRKANKAAIQKGANVVA